MANVSSDETVQSHRSDGGRLLALHRGDEVKDGITALPPSLSCVSWTGAGRGAGGSEAVGGLALWGNTWETLVIVASTEVATDEAFAVSLPFVSSQPRQPQSRVSSGRCSLISC